MRDDRDPAAIDGVGAALAQLIPALDRFQVPPPPELIPAFRGQVPPLPVEGAGLDVVVAELAAAVDHGCRISMPGWLGFITTGATTSAAVAGTALAVAGGQRYLHHAFNHLETVGLRWLAELCGIPPDTPGVFSSGGSTANLVALGAARQSAFERLGVDVAEDGLPATPARIYASDRAHRTVHRSAAVLGLGRAGVREIATDRDGRVDVAALADAIEDDTAAGVVPIAIVAVAGTTDTGAVDPIADLLEIARAHGCWLHVDGAYGLIAYASDAVRHLFDGVREADSWIVDPHKWLATGVGVGATYVRDGDLLTRAFAEGHAAYLEGAFDEPDTTPVAQFDSIAGPWADRGVELSSPPRGALVWAVLREIGTRGVADRVERHIAYARHLAAQVREHPRLELLCEPELSITCYRYVPPPGVDADAINRAILEQLRRTTVTVPTSTVVGGAFALRPCFINPRTTHAEVDDLVRSTIAIGDDLTSSAG